MACAESCLSSAKAPARAQRDKPPAVTTYCQVAVALPVHEPFTYSVPPALLGVLGMGHAVLVPFGPRKITGYVLATGPSVPPPPKGKARPVERLLDPQPAFDATQLSFFRWIADYYRS
ncbi:MAG: primosomal protein N' (replication factor Y), partial [Cognaticolwellia sp.]